MAQADEPLPRLEAAIAATRAAVEAQAEEFATEAQHVVLHGELRTLIDGLQSGAGETDPDKRDELIGLGNDMRASLDVVRFDAMTARVDRHRKAIRKAARPLVAAVNEAAVVAAFDAADVWTRFRIQSALFELVAPVLSALPEARGPATDHPMMVPSTATGHVLTLGRWQQVLQDFPLIPIFDGSWNAEGDARRQDFAKIVSLPGTGSSFQTGDHAKIAATLTGFVLGAVPAFFEQAPTSAPAQAAFNVGATKILGAPLDFEALTDPSKRAPVVDGVQSRFDAMGLPVGMLFGTLDIWLNLAALQTASGWAAWVNAGTALGKSVELYLTMVAAFKTAASELAEVLLKRLSIVFAIVDIILAIRDFATAWERRDYSVALGVVVGAVGGLILVASGIFGASVVAGALGGAAIGGPVGVLAGGALGVIVGTALVVLTGDPQLERFAVNCFFGLNPATSTNPADVHFAFGTAASPDIAAQVEKLASLRNPLGFAFDDSHTLDVIRHERRLIMPTANASDAEKRLYIPHSDKHLRRCTVAADGTLTVVDPVYPKQSNEGTDTETDALRSAFWFGANLNGHGEHPLGNAGDFSGDVLEMEIVLAGGAKLLERQVLP